MKELALLLVSYLAAFIALIFATPFVANDLACFAISAGAFFVTLVIGVIVLATRDARW